MAATALNRSGVTPLALLAAAPAGAGSERAATASRVAGSALVTADAMIIAVVG